MQKMCIRDRTNKGQVDQKWYMGLTYEDDNGNDTDYTIGTDGTIAAVALEDGYGDEFGIIKGEEAYLCLLYTSRCV